MKLIHPNTNHGIYLMEYMNRLMICVLYSLLAISCIAQPCFTYPDNSPSLKDYYKMGWPNVDKKWTFDDYQKTIDVLDLIYSKDKLSLPRFDSKYSKSVFKSLLSLDSLVTHISTDSFTTFISQVEKINTIQNKYLNYYISRGECQYFGEEVISLIHSLMRFYIALDHKMGKFQIGQYDEIQLVQINISLALTQLSKFLIETLSNRSTPSQKVNQLACRYISDTLPSCLEICQPKDIEEIVKMIKNIPEEEMKLCNLKLSAE